MQKPAINYISRVIQKEYGIANFNANTIAKEIFVAISDPKNSVTSITDFIEFRINNGFPRKLAENATRQIIFGTK